MRTPKSLRITSSDQIDPGIILTSDIDSGEFNVADKLVKLDGSADILLAQIPDTLTGKDADTLDTKHYSDISSEIDSDIADHTSAYGHLSTGEKTDLTDAGESTLHYHASDRLIANVSDMDEQSFTNLLQNGDFESWSAGPSSAPDGWTAEGIGVTIARESTIIKRGTYSSKLTRTGANVVSKHTISDYIYYRGRTVIFSAWVYATVAGRGKIGIQDSTGTTGSSYHTGNSTWQLLTVTKIIDAATNLLKPQFIINAGDTSVYFDGAIMVEGSVCPVFSPKPLRDVGVGVDGFVEGPSAQSFTNLLENGSFEFWSTGEASPPDGWASGGVGVAVARNAVNYKRGIYSAAVTRNGNNCYIISDSLPDYANYKGRTVTLGAWVKTSTALQALILLADGTQNISSSKHSGGGDWEWLTVSMDMNAAATVLRCQMRMVGYDGTAYFDGAIIVEGSVCPAFSPHPVDHHSDPDVWKDQSFINIIENGNFESWSAGAAAAPDGFITFGTVTVARDTDFIYGDYSVKLTAGGDGAGISQYLDYNKFQGKTVTFNIWMKASNTYPRLQIYYFSNGEGTVGNSAIHGGDGTWKNLSITIDFPDDMNADIQVQPARILNTEVVYIDGLIAVEGPVCPAFSPKPLVDDGIMLQSHTPSAANDKGKAGQWCYDASFIYICTATDTWKKVAIATW